MKRHFLKDKEIKTLLEKVPPPIRDHLSDHLKRKGRFEVAELERWKVYLLGDRPLLAETEDGTIFPTLIFTEGLALLSKIVVDMGAVPHICNGADLMAPGIAKFDEEFSEGSFITILDERNLKPLAIGLSTYSSQSLKATRQGKVAKNIHYVGDRLWRSLLSQGLARG